MHPKPPVGRGLQSGACAPGGQGELQPHARAARATPAPVGGLCPRVRAACMPPAPCWQEGLWPHARAEPCIPSPRWLGESPAGWGRLQSGMPEQRTCPRPPVGKGNSIHISEGRERPRPPVGRGAPAARQSGARAPGPRLAGELRLPTRAVRAPPAPEYLFLNLHTLKCKENIYLE